MPERAGHVPHTAEHASVEAHAGALWGDVVGFAADGFVVSLNIAQGLAYEHMHEHCTKHTARVKSTDLAGE